VRCPRRRDSRASGSGTPPTATLRSASRGSRPLAAVIPLPRTRQADTAGRRERSGSSGALLGVRMSWSATVNMQPAPVEYNSTRLRKLPVRPVFARHDGRFMADIPIEQALYRREGVQQPVLLARSSGFRDDWLAEAQRLVT